MSSYDEDDDLGTIETHDEEQQLEFSDEVQSDAESDNDEEEEDEPISRTAVPVRNTTVRSAAPVRNRPAVPANALTPVPLTAHSVGQPSAERGSVGSPVPQPASPAQPSRPAQPTRPRPAQPSPVRPTRPAQPTRPRPAQPTRPRPARPSPVRPTRPAQPTRPRPAQPTRPSPSRPAQPTRPRPASPVNAGIDFGAVTEEATEVDRTYLRGIIYYDGIPQLDNHHPLPDEDSEANGEELAQYLGVFGGRHTYQDPQGEKYQLVKRAGDYSYELRELSAQEQRRLAHESSDDATNPLNYVEPINSVQRSQIIPLEGLMCIEAAESMSDYMDRVELLHKVSQAGREPLNPLEALLLTNLTMNKLRYGYSYPETETRAIEALSEELNRTQLVSAPQA